MHRAECPYCESRDTRKDGFYRHKGRARQRFECKACNRKFNSTTRGAFDGLRYAADIVVFAVMLQVQFAMSASQTRLVLEHLWGLTPHVRTLQRWVRRLHPHLDRLERRLAPKFSDVWMIDELFCNRHAHNSKRKPSPKYLFTVLDSNRQVVACLASDHRDAKSVERVVKLALERAGIKPRIISRDGAPIYDTAQRRLRLRLPGTKWARAHFKTVVVPVTERYETMSRRRGPVKRVRRRIVKVSQNHIERYHCMPRARENSMRGVKNAASGTAYFQALGVASNLFKPHAAHRGLSPAAALGWGAGLTWRGLANAL